jgi:hypothetical protein
VHFTCWFFEVTLRRGGTVGKRFATKKKGQAGSTNATVSRPFWF